MALATVGLFLFLAFLRALFCSTFLLFAALFRLARGQPSFIRRSEGEGVQRVCERVKPELNDKQQANRTEQQQKQRQK